MSTPIITAKDAKQFQDDALAWNRAFHDANKARMDAERQRDKLADALRMTLGPLQDHQNLNRSLAASVAYREAVAALSDIDK